MSLSCKLDFTSKSDGALRDKKPTGIQPEHLVKQKHLNPNVNIIQPSTSKVTSDLEEEKNDTPDTALSKPLFPLKPNVKELVRLYSPPQNMEASKQPPMMYGRVKAVSKGSKVRSNLAGDIFNKNLTKKTSIQHISESTQAANTSRTTARTRIREVVDNNLANLSCKQERANKLLRIVQGLPCTVGTR